MDLFAAAGMDVVAPTPLAEKLRPTGLSQIIGQDHLIGPDGPIGRMLARKRLASMILWGPPGVGKTSIARLLAQAADLEFIAISAVFSGVADLKKAFEAAETRRTTGRGTALFVDEIHRFNRSQQDGFLPFVERGVVTLIGATTENPSFALNGALLSRCQVMVLRRLGDQEMEALLQRAEEAQGASLQLDAQARALLCAMADGDGRHLLTLAEELLADPPASVLTPELLAGRLQRRAPAYDRNREEHYGLISALHKAVRASDVDAALYWLARMLQGGEDGLFIARRLIRMAAEDIGMADPQAIAMAVAVRDAWEQLGAPEAELHLAQAVVHLACAPKSNAVYVAWKAAARAAAGSGSLAPPAHALNAPTRLMKELGRGAGYAYDHNAVDGISGQRYFPDGMMPEVYYEPTQHGIEARVAERLARIRAVQARRDEEPQ
jgi:putative ATPase